MNTAGQEAGFPRATNRPVASATAPGARVIRPGTVNTGRCEEHEKAHVASRRKVSAWFRRTLEVRMALGDAHASPGRLEIISEANSIRGMWLSP
jgi:hypothetical protein